MRKLLLKNWRDFRAKKAQFAAIILLTALGVASYFALVSAYLNLSASYEEARTRLKLADFTVSSSDTSASVVNDLRDVPGVKAVQGRFIVDTGLEIDKSTRGTARIIVIPGSGRPRVDSLLLVEGDYLTGPDDPQVLVDKYFADTSHKKPGDTLALMIDGNKERVKIRGVVISPEYLFPIRTKEELPTPGQLAVIFMAPEKAFFTLSKADVYNDFAVQIEPGADVDEVIDDVEEKLEPSVILGTVKQNDQPSNFRMKEEIRQNRELSNFMPPLILIISSLSLYIAMSRLVQSQRGIIGLAKALGYGNTKLLVHYLIFALLTAIGGTLLGFAIGYYLGGAITELYAEFLRLPFLENRVYPRQVQTAAALAFAASAFGGLVPAYAATRMPPAAAMRVDPNLMLSKAKVPLVERFLGLFFRLPFTVKIPLRNVFRVKKRSAYTIIGIAFSLILTTATWASFDSIDYLIKRQYTEIDNWDMVAGFEGFVKFSRIEEIMEFDGVEKAQPALQLPVKLRNGGRSHETVLTATQPRAVFHGFTILRGDTPREALEGGGVIMPEKIVEKLGLKLGEDVSVKSPYQDTTQTVELAAVSEELLGAPVFVNLRTGRELLDSTRTLFNSVYVDTAPNRENEVEKELFDEPGVSQVLVKSELVDNIEAQMEFANTSFIIMLGFAFSVAFVITYNTLTTNVLERTREIATMLTIGEDRRHLVAAITIENLLLALVGIPIGLYLGVTAANAMYESFSTEAYSLKAILYPESYFWVVSSILGVLLISEIPAVRRLFGLDLAEATKAFE